MSQFTFVSRDELDRFHDAQLHILEKIGVKIDHAESVDLLLSNGAERDDYDRVLIPSKMVNEALEKVPKGFQMYDRDGNKAFEMKAGNTVFGTGSDAIFNIDRKNWHLRNSILADVKENTRLIDALEQFDFVMSMALPTDVLETRLYPTVFAEMVANTHKPIVSALTNLADLERVHEIASRVAGGDDAFRAKPFYALYLEPLSPLHIEASVAERALFCAEHEVPFTFAAGANSGSGSPITVEGGVAQGGAESLAGLVLTTLKNPNSRFIYGSNTSSADMRSMVVSYGAPEWYRTVAIYAELGAYYGLPTWGTAGCTDAYRLDAQAAHEAHEGIVLALQCGTTLAHDVGYMAFGSLYDSRFLVLCNAMIDRAKRLLAPLEVTDERLGLDTIAEAARTAMPYMAMEHTVDHFRDCLWLPPDFINRKRIDNLESERHITDLLGDEVGRILDSHSPRPLDDEVTSWLSEYVANC